MNNKLIRVLVTGLSGGTPGLQIVKSLRKSKLELYLVGANITKKSFGASLVDEHYVIPKANDPSYIDFLVQFIHEHNIDVFIPGSEPELKKVSSFREPIIATGVLLPINSKEVIQTCMNKIKTMEFLKENGFNVLDYSIISKREDLNRIKKYPLVIKPYKDSGGSSNVFVVQNNKELNLLGEYLLSHVQTFIAQEYIGNTESEYTVGVLSDMNGELIDSIALKRDLSTALSTRIKVANLNPENGFGSHLIISSGVSQGHIGRYKEITSTCEKISKMLHSQGPLNIQCRYHNSELYVFEINPRYSGTLYMRTLVGFNELEIMIRKHLLNEKISTIDYKEGLILRGLHELIID
jgi:carbamoyl-phosphate synthase large subunit